jgi:hypothetical protein
VATNPDSRAGETPLSKPLGPRSPSDAGPSGRPVEAAEVNGTPEAIQGEKEGKGKPRKQGTSRRECPAVIKLRNPDKIVFQKVCTNHPWTRPSITYPFVFWIYPRISIHMMLSLSVDSAISD